MRNYFITNNSFHEVTVLHALEKAQLQAHCGAVVEVAVTFLAHKFNITSCTTLGAPWIPFKVVTISRQKERAAVF